MVAFFPKPKIKRYQLIKANSSKCAVAKLCKVLRLSRNSYYAWDNKSESNRSRENKELNKIKKIHKESHAIFGSLRITQAINQDSQKPVNHKRVERIMKENDIHSRVFKNLKL